MRSFLSAISEEKGDDDEEKENQTNSYKSFYSQEDDPESWEQEYYRMILSAYPFPIVPFSTDFRKTVAFRVLMRTLIPPKQVGIGWRSIEKIIGCSMQPGLYQLSHLLSKKGGRSTFLYQNVCCMEPTIETTVLTIENHAVATTTGQRHDYIQLHDGPMVCRPTRQSTGGHCEIIKCLKNTESVICTSGDIVHQPTILVSDYAGEIWIDLEKHTITKWNIQSGTFKPGSPQLRDQIKKNISNSFLPLSLYSDDAN